MKNQQTLSLLIIAAVLRNILPFADLYLVMLVVLLLLNQENTSFVSFIAVIVAFVASLVLDSTLGLFPLLLSIHLFLFGVLFQKISNKGIAPLLTWLLFIASVIFFNATIRLVLTTGVPSFPREMFYEIVGTAALIIISTFALSFKKRI